MGPCIQFLLLEEMAEEVCVCVGMSSGRGGGVGGAEIELAGWM